VELARQVREAHDRFITTGRADRRLRPLVVESWQRSLKGGLDPEHSMAPVELLDDELDRYRRNHPLANAMPVIRKLLVQDAEEAGLLVAVSDAAGRLLWVEGSTPVRSNAEGIHFVEGAQWSETKAGTNAPGTALALDHAVQIYTAEHLARSVTPWSCSAAPIHDPDTGAILGALDLTGGVDVAAPHTLTLVRATVAAVEGELRVQRLQGIRSMADDLALDQPVLRTLGRSSAVVEGSHGLTRLSRRHSELLALLAAHREGLSGEQLAVALNEHDHASVTLRAEMSRLRSVLGAVRLDSRPYRLGEGLHSDIEDLRAALATGNVGLAVELYPGPLLPGSDAPGVVSLRETLHFDLRAALIASGDPDPLLRFGDTDHGRDDWQIWQAAAANLDPHSSRWPQVAEHLSGLERELGTA
jgi:transcriptional regulator of acetoin/glycerol metabolism